MDYPYYCAGEWLQDGERLEVSAPATGQTVGVTFRPPAAAVERAGEAAEDAFPAVRRRESRSARRGARWRAPP